MSNLLDRFAASDVAYRTLIVMIAVGFAVLVACVAVLGWQTYQMGLATDRIIHHLLVRVS